MVGTISRMAYVLLVLLDRHRHMEHRHAHPVREVPTPPQLGVTAYGVHTISSRTQREQQHAKTVPEDTQAPTEFIAYPVGQGGI